MKTLAALIVGVAGVLGAIQLISDDFPPARPSVPRIAVEITNSSGNPVGVAPRGDCLLTPPGPGALRTFGRYDFLAAAGTSPSREFLTVAPHSTMRLFAQVRNEAVIGQLLERADCDFALTVRRADGGYRTTRTLPFTKETIAEHPVTVDIAGDITADASFSASDPELQDYVEKCQGRVTTKDETTRIDLRDCPAVNHAALNELEEILRRMLTDAPEGTAVEIDLRGDTSVNQQDVEALRRSLHLMSRDVRVIF